MPRSMTNDMRGILSGENLHVFWMVKIEYPAPTGTARMHTDLGDITFQGETWTGAGGLGNVSPMNEDDGQEVARYSLFLSGLEPSTITELRAERHRDAPVEVYLAARHLANGMLVSDPVLLIKGKVANAHMDVDPDQAGIVLDVVDQRFLYAESANILSSHAQQQARRPGDDTFKFAAALNNSDIRWGPKADVLNTQNTPLDPGPIPENEPGFYP